MYNIFVVYFILIALLICFSEKENFLFSPHPSRILFPSYGTSPSQALKMEEETNAMFRNFASNLVDDVKKLGKGSFGTVILGFWKSKFHNAYSYQISLTYGY